MKIQIPTKQEKEKEKVEEINTNQENKTESYVTTSSGVISRNENVSNQVNRQEAKVNINTATQTQLEILPGIGPSTAMKIITYRNEKGKFNKIEDIKEVNGIGENKYDKIKDLISIK